MCLREKIRLLVKQITEALKCSLNIIKSKGRINKSLKKRKIKISLRLLGITKFQMTI